ncbi:MAG: methyltransferase regulatory domain-containing protein [Rickettsiaceae bacterium]|nr:methyltransferase regulatory domain-containing protein [Rickettsiaceae bacterium]
MTAEQSKESTQKEIEQAYDNFSYVSYPFEYNRPENLRAISSIFGLNTPSMEKARVLEFGSASGGNLIRFAQDYPNAEIVGIDISKKQIDEGLKQIKKFGIKNLTLKHMSITDLDESMGKFDYIICHGIFSWVPTEVREGIFSASKKLLSENGVAFISYNTLPGWNMNNTIREAMLFHAANFEDEKQKIEQARAALNFLRDSLKDQKNSYSKFMQAAADNIAQKENYYLRHEYLAEENCPIYFHDFVSQARKHKLEYLGDTDIHRMYVGNLPPKAAEMLSQINDIVRTEQYIDFMNNTIFRCTILCHNTVNINRNITNDSMSNLFFIAPIKGEVLPNKDNIQNPDINLKFIINDVADTYIAASDPILKAALYVISENQGNPLSVSEIAAKAKQYLPTISKSDLEAGFHNHIGRLIFSGAVKVMLDKPKSIYKISNTPKVSVLALTQAKEMQHANGNHWITNQANQITTYKAEQMLVIQLLDGKNTIKQIKEKILVMLKSGEINAVKDGKQISDVKQLEKITASIVDSTLNSLKLSYGLIA